jgi:hypothetical protein
VIVLFSTMLIVIIMIAHRVFGAYIDPNTGGMLFQLLAVLFTAFSGLILIFSRQIKTMFARFKRFINELMNR